MNLIKKHPFVIKNSDKSNRFIIEFNNVINRWRGNVTDNCRVVLTLTRGTNDFTFVDMLCL